MFDVAQLQPLPSHLLVSDPARIPRSGGFYGVFFDSGQLLLERAGYQEFDTRWPFSKEGYDLLYVGATLTDLRHRALQHLVGNSRASTLRMTVGALLARDLALDPVGDGSRTYFDFGDGEQRLSDWLVTHTRLAVHECDDAFGHEKHLLRTVPIPLNITERKKHPFSRYLMTLRSYYAGRPKCALPRL